MIYLDHAATSPLRPEVLEAMRPLLLDPPGNPDSPHRAGKRAADALEDARTVIAATVGTRVRDVVFTSGATEGINTVMRGLALTGAHHRLLVGAADHKASLATAEHIERSGWAKCDVLPVDGAGVMAPDTLESALSAGPADLVVILDTNNETGACADSERLIATAHAAGVPVLLDATQTLGKAPLGIEALDADWTVLSAHKIGGPLGIGALIARGELPGSLLTGGAQERERRAGTSNVTGAVGFAAACGLINEQSYAHHAHLQAVLIDQLSSAIVDVHINGQGVPGILNVRLPGIDGDIIIARTPDVAIATGSACTSAVPTPSSVLLAMGLGETHARESIRISIGATTTENEVREGARLIVAAYNGALEMNR